VIESFPIQISAVARIFAMKPQSLYSQYRDYISDYQSDIEEHKWRSKDIILKVDEQSGKVLESVPVYVFKPENIGQKMCIDDKCIAHDGHTVVSNYETGKIALLMESTKKQELTTIFKLFSWQDLATIKSISSDMDPVYLSLCDEMLPCATQVIDKFHVIKYVYGSVLDVRLRIKKGLQEQLSAGKTKTEEDKILLKWIGKLNRCLHVLTQSPDKWTPKRSELINEIFKEFDSPTILKKYSESIKFKDLQTAYNIGQSFKSWYNLRSPDAHDRYLKQSQLEQWFKCVQYAQIEEFNSTIKMIKKHQYEIINYFTSGHTNAKAERINGQIERFISNSYGTKDKDFSMYRIALYFS